jgi:hypothetical protein
MKKLGALGYGIGICNPGRLLAKAKPMLYRQFKLIWDLITALFPTS